MLPDVGRYVRQPVRGPSGSYRTTRLVLHKPGNAYTLCVGIIRPASRGSIRLMAHEPAAPLYVAPNYLAAEAGMQALLALVKLCR